MTFRPKLEAYLRQQSLPAHKYGHQPRLYALTREIAALTCEIAALTREIAALTRPAPAFDDDVVFAAAFLHDLGVFIGHRPEDAEALRRWDHVAYTCDRAPELLAGFGFPAEKVPAVLACIREHQPQDRPQSFEATLLRDADILEQLGAIGVLRTAAKLGSDTRFHRFADARNSLQRALDSLPGQIHLEATRELAAPRIAILQAFLAALDAEAGQHLD